jgi:transcriptional regulator with XRE-family HTH domain
MKNIGEFLKTLREGKEISLGEVSKQTKIPIHYLEAIETNNWKLLPASPYIMGYLRIYATYLGLSPDKVINQYKEETKPINRGRKKEKTNYKKPLIFALASVLLFSLFGLYLVIKKKEIKTPTVTQTGKTNKNTSDYQIPKKAPPFTARKTRVRQKLTILPKTPSPSIASQTENEKRLNSSLKVSRISICLDIKNREPIKIKNKFYLTNPTVVYCFTEILEAQEPITIKHVWIYKEKAVMTSILPVKSKYWRTWSKKTIYPDLKGRWKIIIFGPKGHRLALTGFIIE